jgi:adenine-specific DNA-methyltransferase
VEKLNDILVNLLKTDSRYFTDEGELLKNAVYEDAMKMDSSLIKLLLSDDTCKARFFTEVDGVLVFDKVGFGWVINNRQFLPDSYTRFKNKIGLTDGNGDFISSSNDVVLSFPYKDCVLEGGQTKEDQKREEVFYNETLAPEEVDRLRYPKVFTGAKRYTKDGVEVNITFNENDNLIIKGNNLLAIASLLKKYEGKIKLIYIDPPYNTGGAANTFAYNNTFNHSSWLTFMKNRLEIAKRLLTSDGLILCAIDHYE